MQPKGKYTEINRRAKLLQGLRGRIALTKLSLGLEQALHCFWPLFTLVGFAYAIVAFGGLSLLPLRLAQAGVGLVVLAALWFAYRGVRAFSWPNQAQALEKLDQSLENHPIASLQDKPAINQSDPFSAALWQAHIAEMQAQAAMARAPVPAPNLPIRDRKGLRLMALTAVLAALLFAPRLGTQNLQASIGAEALPTGVSVAIEAWATPPVYTGKPAIYLTELADGERIELPIGSEITLRTYGDGAFSLTEAVSGSQASLSAPELDSPPRDARFMVLQDGMVEIFDGKKSLGEWRVSVIADAPPTLEVPEGIGKSREGELSIEFAATDDYGIVSTRYIITPQLDLVDRIYGLAAEPTALPDNMEGELPLPFSQDLSDIKETLLADYSKHIWAHLPVSITLEVTDGAGQTASVELTTDDLPARSFFDPLAGAIVEQRRDMMWSVANDARVSMVLRAVSFAPEDGLFPSSSSYLLLRSAIRRMGYQQEYGQSEDDRVEMQELLWRIASQIENGDLSSAEERLRRAQERLSQALENGATNEEIAGLMDELREATEDYLDQLAQNMEPGQEQAEGQEQGETITGDQLQEMLDRLQELSENGQREEAQQLLEDIRRFMENMEMAQSGNSERREGSAEQQELQDGLQEQQQLSDEAFRQLQEQFGQEEGERDGQSLAERQEQLRQFIEEMQEDGTGGETLEEAERNMGAARDRLEEGDFSGAFDEQARAMENMRQSLREMENREQAGQVGEDGGLTDDQQQLDPLGRPIGDKGRASGDTAVPDQNATDRAKELLDEIRRRSGESERSSDELDYLNRLLDRF